MADAYDVRLGDLGTVTDRDGIWIVSGGATCPDGVYACNAAAREAAEQSEALNVYRHVDGAAREHAVVWRHEWTPITVTRG